MRAEEGGGWMKNDSQFSGLQNWMVVPFTEVMNPEKGSDEEFSFS